MSSTSHSSTCVVDISFNDAVDELFQHTLTAHMLIGTFRFVIDKKFHVWIYWSWWIFEKHEISAFCTASCGRDPSVMQLTSSSSPPWFKSLLFLLLHLQLCNLLIWKKLLSIVLHVLLRGPSMMLLTSCSSIPWLLICLVAPSDFQSTRYFMSEYSALITMTFWKTWFFIILHSLLRKGFFSDAVDKQLQLTLIQMFVFPQSYLKLWIFLIWK